MFCYLVWHHLPTIEIWIIFSDPDIWIHWVSLPRPQPCVQPKTLKIQVFSKRPEEPWFIPRAYVDSSYLSTSYCFSSLSYYLSQMHTRAAFKFLSMQLSGSGADSQRWKWTRLLMIRPPAVRRSFARSLAYSVADLRNAPFQTARAEGPGRSRFLSQCHLEVYCSETEYLHL